MSKRRFFAVILCALILTACSEQGGEERETLVNSITAETAPFTETTAETTSKFGYYTEATTEAVTETTTRFEWEEPEPMETETVRIGGELLTMYNGVFALDKFEGDLRDIIDDIKAAEPTGINISAVNPTEEQAAFILKELPMCEVCYGFESDEDDEEKGFKLCVEPWVDPDCDYTYGEPGEYPEETAKVQNLYRHIGLSFCNFTDEPITVETLRIYTCEDERTPVAFLDGSFELRLDYTVEANHRADPNWINGHDITIGEDVFDYNADTDETHYVAVVTTSTGESEEMRFFIDRNNYEKDFPEQAEMIKKADGLNREFFTYNCHLPEGFDVETQTFEDFYNGYLTDFTYELAFRKALTCYIKKDGSWQKYPGGDRGSSIIYGGTVYKPIHYDGETFIFRQTDIRYHGDYPYSIGWDERNLTLVKTEDGWKAAVAQAAY